MKQLFEYLLGKNKQLKGWFKLLEKDFPDDKKPRFRKNGDPMLWWRAYELLCNNEPGLSKAEILREFGLRETSYATEFAKLAKQNIIVPNSHTRKLEPVDPDKWRV